MGGNTGSYITLLNLQHILCIAEQSMVLFLESRYLQSSGKNQNDFDPPVQIARWALMRHFLSVCLLSRLDQKP